MKQAFASLAVALLACAGAQAATTNTTLTITATGALSGAGITATGTANLTSIGSGSFTSTISLAAVTGTSVSAPFTITLPGGTLTGTITAPVALVAGGGATGTGSATVTGGTGSYAGATGSFPSLAGTATGSYLSSNLTLSFTGAGTITTGGGGPGGPATPTVTAVLDAGGYTSSIAQGSIFVVKGSDMSASGFNQFGFPLPTTSGGVKITFTPASGGSGTDAYLVYTYNLSGVNQLAAILPSTVPVGSYRVTVTNNNGAVSAPFTAPVVQRKLGLITQDSSGSGLASVQNYISASQLDLDRFTTGTVPGTAITISPARPGQVLIAWGTGMGPVTGADNVASPAVNFADGRLVNVQVVVGGMNITPAYAGRAPGLAGADQINFTLPANVPTGCTVPFQVSVNGVLSNPTFIAIAPDASSRVCVQSGFTAAQLQSFDQGGTYTVGGFVLSQISQTVPQFGTVKFNSVGGAFARYTGFQLAGAAARSLTSSDACQVIHVTGSQGQLAGGGGTSLDAGAITLNGPNGSGITNQALKQDPTNLYSLTLGTDGLPAGIPGLGGTGTIVAGTYLLNGAGGRDVGQFNASVTLGPTLTITGGLPSTVIKSAGLPLAWTGGNATDVVQIIGYAGTTTGSGTSAITDATEFICTTTAGRGGFTVPSSILLQLPTVSAAANSSGTGATSLEVVSSVDPTAGNGFFSAPLTAGGSIDAGIFIAVVGIGNTPSYELAAPAAKKR